MKTYALAAIVVATFALPLGGCVNFDPQDWLAGDWFGNKKPLPGERRELFPGGVPGVARGVPADLIKGNQAAALQEQEAEEAKVEVPEQPKPKPKAKPKPKPKPRVVQQETADPEPRPTPVTVRPQAQPQRQQSPGVQWPDPPGTQRQQQQQQPSIWPDPPAPR